MQSSIYYIYWYHLKGTIIYEFVLITTGLIIGVIKHKRETKLFKIIAKSLCNFKSVFTLIFIDILLL